MFTGLIQAVGQVAAIERQESSARLEISSKEIAAQIAQGDSVCINGTCLTVVSFDESKFAVDVMVQTLNLTSTGSLEVGSAVNLELATRTADRLGGHIVQGHVDGTGTVRGITPEGDGVLMSIACPDEVLRYVVEKGSVTVDGVSLTVASREADGFTIALIPHTMAATTLGRDAVGRSVNLEADVVAKYVEALVRPHIPGGETS